MKIAILGGTFDPIHKGHLMMAQAVYASGYFDEIWLMPAKVPPFKQIKASHPDHRLAMCQLAAKAYDYIKVSQVEMAMDGISYTYQTMTHLNQVYDHLFYWIIGYDHLYGIEHWKEAKALLTKEAFVVVRRPIDTAKPSQEVVQHLKDKYGARLLLLDNDLVDISSTHIRQQVKQGLSIDTLVTEPISDYIDQHHLYR